MNENAISFGGIGRRAVLRSSKEAVVLGVVEPSFPEGPRADGV